MKNGSGMALSLTGMDEDGYLAYIRNLKASGNNLAIRVKIADLTNNSDYTRLGVSSPWIIMICLHGRRMRYSEMLTSGMEHRIR